MNYLNLVLQIELVVQIILALGVVLTAVITFYFSRRTQHNTEESLTLTRVEIESTTRSNLIIHPKYIPEFFTLENNKTDLTFKPELENIGDIPAYDIYYAGMVWLNQIQPQTALEKYMQRIMETDFELKYLEISLDPRQKIAEKIVLEFHLESKISTCTIIIHLQYRDDIKNKREKIFVYYIDRHNPKNNNVTTLNETIIDRYK